MALQGLRAGLRHLGAGVAAVLVTAASGSLVQSQHTVAALRGLGVPVSLGEQLRLSLQDLAGFAPTFAVIVAGGFLIAFVVAALLRRWAHPFPRGRLYALAAAVAVLTALLLMRQLLGLAPIPAMLSPLWLAALVACGALGGAVYARLTR
jgi:hypothetical protein